MGKSFFIRVLSMVITAAALASCASAGEHGGKGVEHGGKQVEHGGEKVKSQSAGDKEQDSKEKCTTDKDGKTHCEPAEGQDLKQKGKGKSKSNEHGGIRIRRERQVTAEEIKAALREYISRQTDSNNVFNYVDWDRNGAKMKLRFVKIHDPVRHMEKRGQYFACTDFEVVGSEGQLHDLDFWMVPTGDGLKVVQTKVHKDPVKRASRWAKVPRYKFEGEEIVQISE